MRPSVLLVDDDLVSLRVTRSMLRPLDVDVLMAGTGEEALLVDRASVCCAVLDVSMPGMSGIELARALQSEADEVPVLFVTAEATAPEDAFEGYEVGAADYLLKPVQPVPLRSKVSVFARLWRQRHELEESRRALREANTVLDRLATEASEQAQLALPVVAEFGRLLELHYGAELDPASRSAARALETRARAADGAIVAAQRLARVFTHGAPMVPLDLGRVLDDAADDLDPSPGWLHRADVTSTTVLGDSRQLRRLLRTVLRRARGDDEGGVVARWTRTGGHVQIEIDAERSTSGEFVEPTDGSTFDAVALSELELARIAERHGGRLRFATEGRGAQLQLPLSSSTPLESA